MNWKILAQCEVCHKRSIFICKREIKVPTISARVTSHSLACRSCGKGMQKAITEGYDPKPTV